MAFTSLRRLGSLAAFAVAAAMLLQSLTIALAFSDGTAQIRLDRFGNPICNSADNRSRPGSKGTGHGTLPACCAMGCALFAPSLAGPAGVTVASPDWHFTNRVSFPFPTRIAASDRSHIPGNPRAPPSPA